MLATLIFAVWMLFLDRNNLGLHIELSETIESLEQGKEFYQSELEKNRRELHELESNPEMLEKFARERYWMHREGEEVFLIEVGEE